MPKAIDTPRDELVCGKLDRLESILTAPLPEMEARLLDAITLVNEIRHDCERMEAKLVNRKAETEQLLEIARRTAAHFEHTDAPLGEAARTAIAKATGSEAPHA